MRDNFQNWLRAEEEAAEVRTPELPLIAQASMAHRLQVMFRSGIPLVDCFEALARGEPSPDVAEFSLGVAQCLSEGKSLSASLRGHSYRLGKVLLCALSLGEKTGALALVLKEAAEELEGELELRHKLRKHLTYPIILALGSFLGVLLVLVFLAPKFAVMSGALEQQSPIFQLLLKMALLGGNPWTLSGLLLVVIGLARHIQASHQKARYDKLLLRLPVIGKVNSQAIHLRFSSGLLTLLRSGSMLAPALKFLAANSHNFSASDHILAVHNNLVDGKDLVTAFKDSGFFEPTLLAFVEAGQNSGTLERMLKSYIRLTKVSFESTLESLVALLEPLILAALGLFIGALTLFLFLPMARFSASL